MSRKSEIYDHYRSKLDAANAAIGGEPEVERYINYTRLDEIQALPRSDSWGHPTGQQGYLLPDGRVIEPRKAGYSHFALIFKSPAHHSGYREPMGPTQYFEG